MMGSPKDRETKPKSLAFDFQEISLEEADQLVPQTNIGKYSRLREDIVARLRQNPVPFKFGNLKNNAPELAERERRGICHALNQTLNKLRMGWRVTYSGIGRCFVVKPKTGKKFPPPPARYAILAGPGKVQTLIATASRAFRTTEDEMRNNYKMRKAIAFVGITKGIARNKDLMKYYDLDASVISDYKGHAMKDAPGEVTQLLAAVNGGL